MKESMVIIMRTTLDGIIKAYMGDFQTVHMYTKRERKVMCVPDISTPHNQWFG